MHPLLAVSRLLVPIAGGVFLAAEVAALEFFVNPTIGDDQANGLAAQRQGAAGPLKTVARAVQMAQAGDTIHLDPSTVYHEEVIFCNKAGSFEQPITLDGHGAAISAETAVPPSEWEKVGEDLYRNPRLLNSKEVRIRGNMVLVKDLLQRFFFVWNGVQNRMGRSSKGDQPLSKPADLRPGEWTYVMGEEAFYLRLAPGRNIAEERIEFPSFCNGVHTDGECANIVIRNLNVRRVLNDGFNLHGKTRNLRVENCRASECGDDGLSAHGDCEITVNGFVAERNSTGICHVNSTSVTNRHERVILRDNYAFDLCLFFAGTHEFRNSIIKPLAGAATKVVTVIMPRDEGLRLMTENVLIQDEPSATEESLPAVVAPLRNVQIDGGCVWEARRTSLLSVGIMTSNTSRKTAVVRIHQSLLSGRRASHIVLARGTNWEADDNAYDVAGIQMGPEVYDRKRFDEFRKATGQDAHSVILASPAAGRAVAITGISPSPQDYGFDPGRCKLPDQP